MKNVKTESLSSKKEQGFLRQLRTSIGTKIILPYLLLTVAVAGIGAFIVVRLVSDSWQERFHNQLLDTGRVVSETLVDFEIERLEILRVVAATEGVSEGLAAGNAEALAARVPQIIANSNTDAVELIDLQGREVYGWQRPPFQSGDSGQERSGSDFSPLEDVRLVLNGFVDDLGEKRILLSQTPEGLMLFTVGPVYQDNEIVGAAMVGSYLGEMVVDLAEIAVARVTFYTAQGDVVETSFGRGQQGVTDLLQESPTQYRLIRTRLQESPDRHPVVIATAQDEVALKRVQILGQEYSLAYGDWRLRGQSLGFFSVALPNTFITSTAGTSRNVLGILFSMATVAVFLLGLTIAQRIIRPIQRLVQTSDAVTAGDLSQRTGIQRSDEIGSLAESFDVMTGRLVERNRSLAEQASKLEAILDSTADGIIVLDQQGEVITSNPAAERILTGASSDFLTDILQELPSTPLSDLERESDLGQALELSKMQQTHRYNVGNLVVGALMSPVKTPDGEALGTVIALRDITREVEAERLKDGFITNISHELRTPLTAIKGNAELLVLTANDSLGERQLRYVETINRSTDKLLHHINEIIDISQLQAGNLRLQKGPVNLSELISQVTNQWHARFEDKKLKLQVNMPDLDLHVEADPERLQWAIDNLMSNAYNYTLVGEVSVCLFREDGEARLDVRDTGVGIAVSDQPYLFTRFFRAAPHHAMFEVAGVGLGLFITHSIIESHGGRVWVASELDIGSTFSLAVPLLI